MIRHAINVVRAALHERKKGKTRSPEWHKVERAFLLLNNACASCGGDKRLQVHHRRPFHLHPELELEPSNLVTLCMGPNDCHIRIGHGDDFKAYNPALDEHLTILKTNPLRRPEVEAQAKKLRKYD